MGDLSKEDLEELVSELGEKTVGSCAVCGDIIVREDHAELELTWCTGERNSAGSYTLHTDCAETLTAGLEE